MKQIVQKKQFRKNYERRIGRSARLEAIFKQRIKLFYEGQRGYLLNDHALTGNLSGKRAFSITSDIRVVYEETENQIIFLDVGTHAQVYQ